jgi:serine/threonine protein kinase
MPLEPGQLISNKYRVGQPIGKGGMAEVFEATNEIIRRRVAIKVLNKNVNQMPDLVARFEREAQAAGCIGNDHIVEVLDFGRLEDESPYMVMEFLDGETLSSRLRRVRRMAPHHIKYVVRQVLRGLEAAHAAGIIHRDLKASNIFLLTEKTDRKDFVKVIDFGISKFRSAKEPHVTQNGLIMGSPKYMAPEQASGSNLIDGRTDLYTLGVVLYKAVSGQMPFTGATPTETLFNIVLGQPQPLEQLVPTLDPNFVALVKKAMSREMNARFQTATEFMQALDQWSGTGPDEIMPRQGSIPNFAPQTGPNSPRPLGGTVMMNDGGARASYPSNPSRMASDPGMTPPPVAHHYGNGHHGGSGYNSEDAPTGIHQPKLPSHQQPGHQQHGHQQHAHQQHAHKLASTVLISDSPTSNAHNFRGPVEPAAPHGLGRTVMMPDSKPPMGELEDDTSPPFQPIGGFRPPPKKANYSAKPAPSAPANGGELPEFHVAVGAPQQAQPSSPQPPISAPRSAPVSKAKKQNSAKLIVLGILAALLTTSGIVTTYLVINRLLANQEVSK